jgi:hypothetical protein
MTNEFSQLSLTDSQMAHFRAFVYVIYVRNHRAMYIGQTRSRTGALGRLSFHLSEGDGSTIKTRIAKLFHFDEVILRGIRFAAFPLASLKVFSSDAQDYREAVEALIQQRLLEKLTDGQYPVPVVSRIRHNDYMVDESVVSEADRIFPELWQWFLSINDNTPDLLAIA